MEDRLDKGDYIYNQKTGEISRKPVSLKEARGATNDLLQRQAIIEKLNLEERNTQMKQSVNDQLEMLKQQFASFQTGRTIEVVPTVVKENDNALHDPQRSLQEMRLGESENEDETSDAEQESEVLSSDDMFGMREESDEEPSTN